MRNPNGYGCIRKLSGKRKRPYGVYITTEFKLAPAVPEIGFLAGILSPELYNQVQAEYEAYKAKQPLQGRQVQQCIGYYETRPEAMIALAEYNKNPFDIENKDITFAEIYNMLYEKNIKDMKKSAKTAYETAYQKCDSLKNMPMRKIRLAHLQGVVDQYSHKSKSTQNNIIVLFHAIYNLCMENDIIEKNYSSYVKITSTAEKKPKRPFTRKQVRTVWDNIDWIQEPDRKNYLSGIPMMDSIIIMFYTGMRIGELLDLKPADIHLKERWIDLRGTKTKAAQRIIPIHKKIIPLLEKRIEDCPGNYLFCRNDGTKLTYSIYKTVFYKPFMKEFGIDRQPHECRHTFASIAAASKLNPVLLKKIIGHSSSDITESIYTHAYIEDLIAEIDKFKL